MAGFCVPSFSEGRNVTIILRQTAHSRHDDKHRVEFDRLTREEVSDAIADMKALGFGDYDISAACGLAVEQIREILGQRRERGQKG